MKQLRYPRPTVLHGENLRAEIAAGLGMSPDNVAVSLSGDEVEVVVPDAADDSIITAVVAAHTGQPTAAQQAERAADDEAATAFGDLGPLLAKARAVRAGTDTFTAAQLQRIVAALVLLAARRLR